MLFVICNIFRRYDTGVTWCVMWSVGLVTPQTVSNFLNRHASWQLILLLLWHCWQWYAGLTTMKHHLYRVTKTHISCPWQCASFKLKFVILVVEPDRRESQFPGMNIFCQILGSWDSSKMVLKKVNLQPFDNTSATSYLCNIFLGQDTMSRMGLPVWLDNKHFAHFGHWSCHLRYQGPFMCSNISSKLLGSLLLICTSWSPGGLCVFYLFSGRHVQDKYTDKMCSTNTLNIYRGEEIGYSYFWQEFQVTLGLRAALRFMVFSRSNPKH